MTNNQSNEPENREQTFDEKLDAILQRLSLEQQFLGEQYSKDQIGELEFQSKDDDARDEAKQAIKTLVLEDVVGDSEVHVSHVCPQDSVGCAKYAQRCATRRHQRQIINPQKEGEQCQHYQACQKK